MAIHGRGGMIVRRAVEARGIRQLGHSAEAHSCVLVQRHTREAVGLELEGQEAYGASCTICAT
jgi:hypothetical protein